MRTTFLVSASAIALIAGGNLALAQGMKNEGAAQPAPSAIQSAPAEKIAPAPKSETTGQGAPARMEQERPQGAQAPAARDGQKSNGMKAGDTKASDKPAVDNKSSASGKTETKTDTKSSASGKAESNDATTGQGAAATSANLTTEQRTKIKTTIKQTNVRPVTNVNFNISVGTVVPRTIELHPLPATIVEVYPAWRGYRFVLVADEIIIIEPGSYRIVAVIDA